jgi:hypothetical protein
MENYSPTVVHLRHREALAQAEASRLLASLRQSHHSAPGWRASWSPWPRGSTRWRWGPGPRCRLRRPPPKRQPLRAGLARTRVGTTGQTRRAPC